MTSSAEIHTGDIGEALCYYRLLQMGVPCRIVNLGATDILAILNDEITVRIQVKTAHRAYDSRYVKTIQRYGFNLCRGSKVKRSFEEHEIDVFACVGLDDEQIVFMTPQQARGRKTYKVSAKVFEDPQLTEESWNKVVKQFLYR